MWLDEDRAWALALQAEEDETCGGCGQSLDEAADAGNEFAYKASVYRCHACTAKEKGSEEYKNEPPGLYVGVTRRTALGAGRAADQPGEQ